jgi:hypothetical protein
MQKTVNINKINFTKSSINNRPQTQYIPENQNSSTLINTN